MSLMELKNIHMFFDTSKSIITRNLLHVLKDVNLNINPGEVVAIVGESGCGKTTLGKIITRIIEPTLGDIYFRGVNIKKMTREQKADLNKSVQIVHQDSYAALNPVRTIYYSLYDPIRTHFKDMSKDEIDRKIIETLNLVGLTPAEQFIHRYPHQFSGGQRQRILMARAIVLNPAIIVADEPVSMIDVSLRASILNLMLELNKKFNIAFVYITHDLATAKYIADNGRLCVMYLGEIVEEGDVNTILHNPRHPYTQALITAVPIPDPEKSLLHAEIPLKSLELTSLHKRPKGCSFYPRCLYSKPECENNPPEKVHFDDVDVLCSNLEGVKQWEPIK